MQAKNKKIGCIYLVGNESEVFSNSALQLAANLINTANPFFVIRTGFPYLSFPTGKSCFHYRSPLAWFQKCNCWKFSPWSFQVWFLKFHWNQKPREYFQRLCFWIFWNPLIKMCFILKLGHSGVIYCKHILECSSY